MTSRARTRERVAGARGRSGSKTLPTVFLGRPDAHVYRIIPKSVAQKQVKS
jgi:hypothetical protein